MTSTTSQGTSGEKTPDLLATLPRAGKRVTAPGAPVHVDASADLDQQREQLAFRLEKQRQLLQLRAARKWHEYDISAAEHDLEVAKRRERQAAMRGWLLVAALALSLLAAVIAVASGEPVDLSLLRVR